MRSIFFNFFILCTMWSQINICHHMTISCTYFQDFKLSFRLFLTNNQSGILCLIFLFISCTKGTKCTSLNSNLGPSEVKSSQITKYLHKLTKVFIQTHCICIYIHIPTHCLQWDYKISRE